MKNDAATFYSKHYRTQYFLLDKELALGDKDNRKCRFCGLTNSKKFKKDAHAIPQLLGNKYVLSYYECDNCNRDFGQHIENQLGNYSGPFRTLTLLQGSDGIPAHKRKGIIDIRAQGGDTVQIKVHDPDSRLVTYDERSGEIKVSLERGKYIPMAVYKAYVKMALTMMDEADFVEFPVTLRWIKETKHVLKHPLVKLNAYTKFIDGKHIFYLPEVYLLFRKSDAPSYLPYAWMVLCTGNQVIQIMVPYSDRDEGFQEYLEQGYIPSFIPHPHLLRPGAYDQLDWSSTEHIKNEPMPPLTLCSIPGQITVEDEYDFSGLLREHGLEEDF
ncbi:HNH endonuclease [Paenibacillus amylolyticus]|uniref:HNH endonuclease n=1 Tax=Paenibacillus amylolyticus TaxID=1451 RepID=UPI0033952809